jgi:hypothetical protein
MRDLRGSAVRINPDAECAAGDIAQDLYIINLCASNAPIALEALNAPELGGFAVFRSRRAEDGRDRFRLHLGFFDSQQQAEKFLPLVRDRYPAAWVALAPEDSMGSLDDTSVAQFKFIPQRKNAAPAPQPPAQGAPAPTSGAVTVPAETLLRPAEVLNLLESPPAAPMKPSAQPQSAGTAATSAGQSFAVQLIWSTERPDTARIPRLAIFDAYTLYTVTMKRAGRLWYGVRLGFFDDPVSARQVSLYVRSDFSAAAVVPVSERECARAGEAAQAVLQKEVAARARQQNRSSIAPPRESPAPLALATETGPLSPKSDVALAQADFRRTLETLDHPRISTSTRPGSQSRPLFGPQYKTRPASAPQPKIRKPARVSTGAARRGEFTTEQLLEELGAGGLSFEGEGHDPLTDTGVRHLSIAVVKRKRGFGGLFSRISGRD